MRKVDISNTQDSYHTVSSQTAGTTKPLSQLIGNSQCNKARLLHYFPPSGVTNGNANHGNESVDDDACGLHLDHSLLTGLCESGVVKDGSSGFHG